MILKLLFLILLSLPNISFTQNIILKDMATNDMKSVSYGSKSFLLVKSYTGLSRKDRKIAKDFNILTYSDVPLDSSIVEFDKDLFETKLICLEADEVIWTKPIGHSNTTRSSGLATDSEGFIYTGEKNLNKQSINIVKFDLDGKKVWSRDFDSLLYIHDIYANDSDVITLQVSYTYRDQIEFDLHYFFQTLKIKKSDGTLISKVNNDGINFFSTNGFSDPILASHADHYFYNGDTLVYARNDSMMLRIVSERSLSDHEVVDVIGKEYTYFVMGQYRNDSSFRIIRNNWAYENGELYINLLINPHAEILKVRKNEVNGVSVFYQLKDKIGMVKLDADLEVVTKNESFLDTNQFEVISDILILKDGKISVIGINQKKKKRTVSVLSKTENGL